MRRAAILSLVFLALGLQGQQQPDQQPNIRLNYMNVCTPSAEEQGTLKNALAKVAGKPAFATDFEVSRGQTTMKDEPPSRFVRVRRDFASESPLLTAQYSMSKDEKSTVETLVLRLRDPKEFHEVSIEDRVSTEAATPVTVVGTDTPAARIRIERMGKGSVGLTRCPGVDQGAYEDFFKQASDLMAKYRAALGLRTSFRSDIAWLGAAPKPAAASGPHKQP